MTQQSDPETRRGRTAADFLEGEAGGEHHRAVIMADLQSVAEHAYEEFRYEDDIFPAEWLAAVQLIAETELPIFPAYNPEGATS